MLFYLRSNYFWVWWTTCFFLQNKQIHNIQQHIVCVQWKPRSDGHLRVKQNIWQFWFHPESISAAFTDNVKTSYLLPIRFNCCNCLAVVCQHNLRPLSEEQNQSDQGDHRILLRPDLKLQVKLTADLCRVLRCLSTHQKHAESKTLCQNEALWNYSNSYIIWCFYGSACWSVDQSYKVHEN